MSGIISFSRQRAVPGGRSALTMRLLAQKHGSESIITRSTHRTVLKLPGAFTSSIGAR